MKATTSPCLHGAGLYSVLPTLLMKIKKSVLAPSHRRQPIRDNLFSDSSLSLLQISSIPVI
jgi:hypothetical protein